MAQRNVYKLVNAHRLIQLLHNIENLCEDRYYNHIIDIYTFELPYLRDDSISFYIYRRDSDRQLYKLVKRAVAECERAKGQVLLRTHGKLVYLSDFYVKPKLVKRPDEESLIRTPPSTFPYGW